MLLLFLDLIYSKFFFLITGLAGIVGYMMMTWILNWSMKVKWSRDIWPAIKGGNYAVAIYFAALRLGTCLLIGCAMYTGAIV